VGIDPEWPSTVKRSLRRLQCEIEIKDDEFGEVHRFDKKFPESDGGDELWEPDDQRNFESGNSFISRGTR
jgi:hypothetical protein